MVDGGRCGKPIVFHETTLRDGEQTPGVSFFQHEKLQMAQAIAQMLPGCVLDAGYPAISEDEARAVRLIAAEVRDAQVFCVARAIRKDVEQAWSVLEEAESPRVCSILPISDLLLRCKMGGMSRQEAVRRAVDAVTWARLASHDCAKVDFALEDATRADEDFACEITAAVVEAGAEIIFVCDSLGVSLPHEFAGLISKIHRAVPTATLAAHTHNDLGLAVANTLAAVDAGATVVSSSMNGLGERAGNAATEELMVALMLRRDHYRCDFRGDAARILDVSRMVAEFSGIHPHAVKPIVGEVTVGVRETGPQVDGIFEQPETYEGIPPELLGLPALPDGLRIIVGKKSSRGAVARKLAQLGVSASTEEALALFRKVKDVSAYKKAFSDDDLLAMFREVQAPLDVREPAAPRLVIEPAGSEQLPHRELVGS